MTKPARQPSEPRTLSARQRAFVSEYVIDRNATQAAIRAGYGKGEYGRQLVTKPHVRAAIDAELDRMAAETGVTAERVIKELARLAFSDVRDLASWSGQLATVKDSDEISDDAAAAIQEVGMTPSGIKLKLVDKRAALEALGKHLGIFERDNAQQAPVFILSDSEQKL